MEEETCDVCGYSIPGDTAVCPGCGDFEVNDTNPYEVTTYDDWKPTCDACGGTGYSYPEGEEAIEPDTCKQCDGTGQPDTRA